MHRAVLASPSRMPCTVAMAELPHKQQPLHSCGSHGSLGHGKGSIFCFNSWVLLVHGSSFLCNNSQCAWPLSRNHGYHGVFPFLTPSESSGSHSFFTRHCHDPCLLHQESGTWRRTSHGAEVQEARPHTGRHWRSNFTSFHAAFLLLWHIFL